MFFKIDVLKIFTIFTGKHLCWNNFIKNKLQLWFFPVNTVKILRTGFFIEHLQWLFPHIYFTFYYFPGQTELCHDPSRPTTTHHHPPPSTTNHHQPKYIHDYLLFPKKWITTPQKPKYSHIQPPVNIALTVSFSSKCNIPFRDGDFV